MTKISGPASFSRLGGVWWRVFRAALYMLRLPAPPGQREKMVVTAAAATEEYYENIAKLNEGLPEAWHLDCCRAGVFEDPAGH